MIKNALQYINMSYYQISSSGSNMSSLSILGSTGLTDGIRLSEMIDLLFNFNTPIDFNANISLEFSEFLRIGCGLESTDSRANGLPLR